MQDWRVKENANVGYSFSSLFLQAAGEMIARYTLSKVYPREIARAHIEGDMHIHNLPFGIVGYCAGWSIKDILLQGFSGVPARTESSPSRHFSSALLQISNFLGSIQNEWSISKDELLLVANENIWKIDKISELPEKVRVFAFDSNLLIKEAEGKVVKHGKSRLLEISTWHGHKVKITPDHSLFTVLDGKVMPIRGTELKVGDKILIPIRLPFVDEKHVFDLTQTSTEKTYGDRLIHIERGWHEVSKFIKLDESLATLFGFYVTEGSMRDERVGADIFFSIARSESCLEDAIVRACGRLGFPCRVYKPSFRPSETYIFVGSKLVRDLFVAKCGRGEKSIPPEIFRSKKEIVAAFLKACFSGDGYAHCGKHGNVRVCYKSTSKKLRSGILYLIRMFGIVGKPTGNAVFVSGRRDVEKFYREIGFYHKEKMALVRNYLKKSNSPTKMRWIEPLLGTDLALVRIRNIRELPEEEVYDISVPGFENFVGGVNPICLHNSGAQAVNSLDIYLAPFVRRDALSYKQVKQAMQEFIYNLNISSRWGSQTPFTNITFELKIPEDMKNEPVIYGGKTLDETYADYQPEADLINRAFLDVMLHGDMRERIFTFPIPTYNVTKDFDWDSDISNLLFKTTAKFGIPYFQNCIKGGIDPREVRSMCCRLMLDLKELHRRYGGFFGYADKTGSVGVCTINMPRLGYVSKDESEFFEQLEHLMKLAKDSLEIKRKLVDQNIKRGLLPFSARYLGNLKFHFSTIGLVGMHEACLNFLGEGIQTKNGKDFAIKTLKFMRERLVEFQDETGNIYNLEATPAEGSLAPEEKVLIAQSEPRFAEIGPLIDKYLERNKGKIETIGTSEILKIPKSELFTYGFSKRDLKIKKYPVTALVRHSGKSMYEIETLSGRRAKVTGQHSVFSLSPDGIPQEVLVNDLREGDFIAIPKKIEMEKAYHEFNLIDIFKNVPYVDRLYCIFPANLIEKLVSEPEVRKWAIEYYKFAWKDAKCMWRKSRVVPLKLIYDLHIEIERKFLKSSKIFYRKTKNTNPINVLIPINKKLGFIIGSLLSEGWLGKRIEFVNADRTFAKEFFQATSDLFGSGSVKLSSQERKPPRKLKYTVTLGKMIGLFFSETGLAGKSGGKKIPNFVFFTSFECIQGLLRGFYLGYGYLWQNKKKNDFSIRLYTNSQDLVEGLNLLLLQLGILTKIRKEEKNLVLSITGAESLEHFFRIVLEKELKFGKVHSGREIIPNVPKLIKSIMKEKAIKPSDIGVWKDCLNRDIRKGKMSIQYFRQIVEKLSELVDDKKLEKLRKLANSDLYWDKVKRIKRLAPPKHVYDLEVEVENDLVNNFLGGEGLVCLHNTSYRLARLDKKHHPRIITAGKKVPYYTNSSHLPVGYTNDLFEALRHQDDLQIQYNGGTILHCFLGEAMSSPEGCKLLVRRIAENFKLPYFTITPTFSICMEHGYLRGEHFKCPHCGKPAEVYSRVVGYYRPVENWHVGKREEFKDRLEYDEKIALEESRRK